ncbi:hypothetical protein S1OALGB6SA_172 [Olavius algarvensis spirochete endosymbiont]|nr:hypothetical protein S1OALGB6SA_172 [Olavius algarvensis spirochete endosymbiont]
MFYLALNVSIHAPARGATASIPVAESGNGFQSTHPRGVRQAVLGWRIQDISFQSTHPRGVRQGVG